ncbi:MAG TPA: TonB family protein [Nitrospirota bacterium]
MKDSPRFGISRSPWGLDTGGFTAVSFALHVLVAILLLYPVPGGAPRMTEVSLMPVEAPSVCDPVQENVQEPPPTVQEEAETAEPVPAPLLEDALHKTGTEDAAPVEELPTPEETAAENTAPEPSMEPGPAPQPVMQEAARPGQHMSKCPGVGQYWEDDAVQYGPGAAEETRVAYLGEKGGPVVISAARPKYPFFAAFRRIEGWVVLKLQLDETGAIMDISVVQPAGYGFDEAAIEAALNSVFGPAVIDGKPAACVTLLPVKFRL